MGTGYIAIRVYLLGLYVRIVRCYYENPQKKSERFYHFHYV